MITKDCPFTGKDLTVRCRYCAVVNALLNVGNEIGIVLIIKWTPTSTGKKSSVFRQQTWVPMPNANGIGTKRLCPFNNKVPNCTKDKAQDPLGVCSVFHENEVVITWPNSFLGSNGWLQTMRQNFSLGQMPNGQRWPKCVWRMPKVARREILMLFCAAYDKAWQEFMISGRLEVQAFIFRGMSETPFEHYMDLQPKLQNGLDRRGKLSSARLSFIISQATCPHNWFSKAESSCLGQENAVALNKAFFNTLPKLPEVPKEKADIAWMIYDLKPQANAGQHYWIVSREDCLLRVWTRIESNNKIPSRKDGRFYLSFAGEGWTRSWKRHQ